jgi:predicted DsbA family dithiol-disulfide isomerase
MSKQPVQIEIFTDFICPWCYLASGVVAKLQQELPLQVQWTPFPLNPRIPPEGMLLATMLPGMDLDSSHKRLYSLMDELGLPHGQRTRIYNSRLAQEVAMWANTQTGGAVLWGLLYRAYFVKERNLADAAVLLQVVHEAGLDVEAAGVVLAEGTFSAEVDACWQRARELQISGIPTFIAGGYQMTGYNPEAELRRFIEFVQAEATA